MCAADQPDRSAANAQGVGDCLEGCFGCAAIDRALMNPHPELSILPWLGRQGGDLGSGRTRVNPDRDERLVSHVFYRPGRIIEFARALANGGAA